MDPNPIGEVRNATSLIKEDTRRFQQDRVDAKVAIHEFAEKTARTLGASEAGCLREQSATEAPPAED